MDFDTADTTYSIFEEMLDEFFEDDISEIEDTVADVPDHINAASYYFQQ